MVGVGAAGKVKVGGCIVETASVMLKVCTVSFAFDLLPIIGVRVGTGVSR